MNIEDRYRLTRVDALDALYPAKRDHRPRLIIPTVDALPPLGQPDPAWDSAAVTCPFARPLELARTLASSTGHEVWSLADAPELCIPADPALRTTVRILAWEESPRSVVLRVLFECGEPDIARLTSSVPDSPSLDRDHVSMILNPDRAYDRAVEAGVTCDGHMFTRPFIQFVGAHSSESTLAAAKVDWIGEAAPTVGRPEDKAFEDPDPQKGSPPRANVWFEADRWCAELQIPLNLFGQYADRYAVYPANFFRHHPVCPKGSPSGISWRATPGGFTWAPVRFSVEEFEKAGFVAVGPLDEARLEQQIRTIDTNAMRMAIERRIDLTARKAETDQAWRGRIDPRTYDSQWLGKALPGYELVERGFVLNNSRQLLTLDDGRCLVLAEDAHKLSLVIAPQHVDPVANDLSSQTIQLVGKDGICDATAVSHASMARAADGRLHVVFAGDGACWHASSDSPDDPAALLSPQRWTVRHLPVPERAKPCDIERLGEDVVVIFADDALKMSLLSLSENAPPAELPFEGCCPVLARASDGGLHMAFEFNGTIYYAKANDALAIESDPGIAAYAIAFFPAIIEVDGAPLIAYQHLGVQKADPAPNMYVPERERTGSGIGAARLDEDDRWTHMSVVKFEEHIVRRLGSKKYMLDMVNAPHRGVAFPLPDEHWRPSIGQDGNGVVRIAWQNTTRNHAFVAQWNSQGFGRPEELAGPFPYPTPHIGIEKYAAPASELKHLFVAERRLLLDAHPTCAINLERSPEVYFLDETAVHRRNGLCWHLNSFERYRANPIMEAPGTGRGGGRDGLARAQTIMGTTGRTLIMAEARWSKTGSEGGYVFAESDDGRDFQIISRDDFLAQLPDDLRELLAHGSGETDGLAPGYDRAGALGGFEDPLEPDPEKRFKRMLIEGRQIDPHAARRVYYSPDGKHWTKGPAAENNNHLNETHLPNVYDPWDKPERRFKIYGRTTTPQGRTLGMLWSEDIVHWRGDVAQVVYEDPYGQRPPETSARLRGGWVTLEGSASSTESEHYYSRAWLEGGLYMVFYANLNWNGHKSLRLAFSRDGFHFKRVGDREILDVGPPGSFDSGSIDCPVPFVAGDELRLYYSAAGEKHGSLPYTAQHCIGLATLGRKRWSYFSLAEGVAQGQLLSVRLPQEGLVGRTLTVNAAGISNQDDLRIELVDAANGTPLPGYEAANMDALADGFDVPVTWQRKPVPGDAQAGMQVRFIFTRGSVRLYSFALPKEEA